MSGIVGIINQDGQPVDRQLLRQMTDFMTYRGPDAQEVWANGPVGLGHTMLRTTFEAEQEHQPCSLEGQVWISADARIDGRAELICRLEGLGCHDLKDVPDPELILHAYHVWGEDCLQHLLGDFAFAIWDGPRRLLFCARDHFGVKPFYYAQIGHCLVFSNTLKCIRLYPEVSDELNDLAIADFLLFDVNQDPATTTFCDIKRIPPAHYLTLQNGVLRVRGYWTLPISGLVRYKRQQDYVDHFRVLLHQAVSDRLRTRQVGVFMSGGLDSSHVAAFAKNFLGATSAPYDLRAYTIVYDRLVPDEERHYAGIVAGHLNIPISYLAGDGYRLYERWHHPDLRCPEPYHDPLRAIWIDLLRQASAHCRVCMTGDGGDEILYPSKSYFYRLLKRLRLGRLAVETGRSVFLYGRLPQIGFRSGLRRWFGKSSDPPLMPEWLNSSLVARFDLKTRWQQFRAPPKIDHPNRPEACRIILYPVLQQNFEIYYDPGVTHYPIEIRHPMMDLRLIKFALTLPPLPWCVEKLLLREAGGGMLPEEINRRPKSPMAVDPWLQLLRQSRPESVNCCTAVTELARYVNQAAVPPVTGGKAREVSGWVNLRPVSLDHWLQNLSAP